jgi:hypothetical protein
VGSYQYQKKVSTWTYKVLSYLPLFASSLVDLLIRLSPFLAQYGKAEFQSGMEEVDDTATTSSVAIPAPTSNELPTVGELPITDHTVEEGYTLLQKGLFLAVILGCVAVYLRLSSKKSKGRFSEKSMA